VRKRRKADNSSLVTRRRNAALANVLERHVPARLLQGSVPSALLEAHRFWAPCAADDRRLCGEPLDASRVVCICVPPQDERRRQAGGRHAV
jgi:hypothetical protein